ncbi:VOC family protein [Brevundimonas sp.]|uniref:VOC family protein n=1 Tax=Brevundimonas sp. TaxID=1871086 RepID=UPI00391B3A63|nr:VOC family protein [Brevundimonas sp.]
MSNPVAYFEIPVRDLDRAQAFYERVLDVVLERQIVDGYEMALFPWIEGAAGATGALARGDVYLPSRSGALVYFTVTDIEATVHRGQAEGAAILYPIKSVPAGRVAELEDTEGNRMALFQPNND